MSQPNHLFTDCRKRVRAPCNGSTQQGISLFIVLIALILMSLSAVGLIRMVDTSSLVAGNLAFKQGATSAADRAVEEAIQWLATAATNDDNANAGYYSTSYTALDISGKSTDTTRVLVDWKRDNCAYASASTYSTCIRPAAANSVNGYATQYLITRMCKTTGDVNAPGNSCLKPLSNTSSTPPAKGSLDYTNYTRFSSTAGPYFRIAVRSEGPRNTVSYTETYIHY